MTQSALNPSGQSGSFRVNSCLTAGEIGQHFPGYKFLSLLKSTLSPSEIEAPKLLTDMLIPFLLATGNAPSIN